MDAKLQKFKILCLFKNLTSSYPVVAAIERNGFDTLSTEDLGQAQSCISEQTRDITLFVCDAVLLEHIPDASKKQLLSATQTNQIPLLVWGRPDNKQLCDTLNDLQNVSVVDGSLSDRDLDAKIKETSQARQELLREQRILEDSFLSESRELLDELEILLLRLDERPQDLANISSIFRVVHTIKGASGVLSLSEFTSFLHKFEDILSQIKDGKRSATLPTITGLLGAYDVLTKTISELRAQRKTTTDLVKASSDLEKLLVENHDENTAIADNKAKNDVAESSNHRESVAVPTQMLDEFLHLTGETTVIRNMVNKLVRSIERQIPGNEDVELLVELLEEMHKINATMQTKTAELRKTPMKQVLKKLPRTIRDISTQLGKKTKITISGEDLRVDTAIAQALSNSLIHMIRNAVDHGIELPDTRVRAGKSPEGSIRLSCREVRDFVVIEVADDGAGIDPERIRAKLREQGRIDLASIDAMDRERLLRQIFEPGFSTAAKVTDVSGRGVGMDMVQTSIDQLKGRIEVTSDLGRGTSFKFTIPIPKSVVIINALIVSTEQQSFAIPQDNIVRLMRVPQERFQIEIAQLPGSSAIRLNDGLIPLVNLDSALNITASQIPKLRDELNVVIAKWDSGTYGIIVDSIQDAEDIVVKSLHPSVERIGAYSGATFLGDGSVALIIDVGGIARITGQLESQTRNHQVEPTQSSASTSTSESMGIPGQDYVLFELDQTGVFALPIENIFRIEEISRDLIVSVGNRLVIRYRDELIPIIDFSSALDGSQSSRTYKSLSDKTSTLIITLNNRLFATPICRVLEVTRIESELKKPSHPSICIKGLFTQEKRVITLIDIPDILKISNIEFDNTPNIYPIKRPAETPVELIESNYKNAAGWGLF